MNTALRRNISVRHATLFFRVGTSFLAALILTASGSFLFTRTAHAQVASVEANPAVITGEVSSFFKKVWDLGTKVGLDKAAWSISKKAIQSMTKSTVKWIRTGRGGASMYVTDLQNDMLQLGDAVAGNFIRDVAGTDFICSPFRLELASLLDIDYFKHTSKAGFFENNKCTLSGIWGNATDFYNGFVKEGDFSKGGWQGWFELAAKPQGNIYGSYVSGSAELGARLVNAEGDQINLLDWANGFFSWCGDAPVSGTSTVAKLNNQTCRDEEGKPRAIRTPGSVIEDQLAQQLGSGVRQLELADSFNEIVFAAATELVQGLTQSGGNGLSGATSRYVRETTTFLADFIPGSDNPAEDENGRAYSSGTRTIKSLINNILEHIDTVTDARDKTATLLTAAQRAKSHLAYVAVFGSRGGYNTQGACPVIANLAIKTDIQPVLDYVGRIQEKSNLALDQLELMAAKNRALEASILAVEEHRFDLEEEAKTIRLTELSDQSIARLLAIEEELEEVNEELIAVSEEAEEHVLAFDSLLMNEEQMLLASEIGVIIQNTTPGSNPPTTMLAKMQWYSAKSDDKHQCSNIYQHAGGLRDSLDALLLTSKRQLLTAQEQYKHYSGREGYEDVAARYAADVTRLTASTTALADESFTAANSPYGGGVAGPEAQEWRIEQYTDSTARAAAQRWQLQVELFGRLITDSGMSDEEAVDAGAKLGFANDLITGEIRGKNFTQAGEYITSVEGKLSAVADLVDANKDAEARSALATALDDLPLETISVRVNGSQTPSTVVYDTPFTVTWTSSGTESCKADGDTIFLANSDTVFWDENFDIGTSGSQSLRARVSPDGFAETIRVGVSCEFEDGGDSSVFVDVPSVRSL